MRFRGRKLVLRPKMGGLLQAVLPDAFHARLTAFRGTELHLPDVDGSNPSSLRATACVSGMQGQTLRPQGASGLPRSLDDTFTNGDIDGRLSPFLLLCVRSYSGLVGHPGLLHWKSGLTIAI